LQNFINRQNFSRYLEEIIDISAKANEYIDKEAPWVLRKEDPARMNTVLYVLLELIRVISLYFLPVMNNSANKILDFLAVNNKNRNFSNIKTILIPGQELPAPEAVFPRIAG